MEPEEKGIRADNEKAAEEFLRILNNREKMTKGGERFARKKGFVVVVRKANSLQALQSLCEFQEYNRCLTVRYRVQSPPIFGTLIASFVSDIQKIQSDMTYIRGSFRPEPSAPEWMELIKRGFYQDPYKIKDFDSAEHGQLDPDWLNDFIRVVSNEKYLSTGDRLVIFGEVIDHREDQGEWEIAMRTLLRNLPERFGFVILGAPENYTLPSNDAHFLDIDWVEGIDEVPEGIERSYSYRVPSLQHDQPAEEDLLGVQSYAVGLARLILHEQTKPLTIGIQAPWGRGKSSFMRFVDRALVGWAPVNKSTLTSEFEVVERRLFDIERRLESEGLGKKIEEERGEGHRIEESRELQGRRTKLQKTYQYLWREMKRNALDNVVTVHFNAWQYEDTTQIWAGLASRVSKRMEEVLPWIGRILTPLTYAWHNRKTELIVTLIAPVLGAILLGLGLLFGFRPEFNGLLNQLLAQHKSPSWLALSRIFVPVGSGLFLFWFAAWRVLSVLHPVSKRVLGYIRLPDYRDQMGYQHRVLSDLQFMYGRLKKWRKNSRIVVFIDDLDRCSEGKIIEMLQAINLILGVSDFFVLLGIDTEMLYRAIRSYYTKNREEQSLPENFPEDYLRKIIQLPFHLPESPAKARFSLVQNLFSQEAQAGYKKLDHDKEMESISWGEEEEQPEESLSYDFSLLRELSVKEPKPVEDTVAELEAYGDFQEFLEDNPREIKRLVNVHRLVKILLQLRHPDAVWPEHQQRKLVKWLIFCARWPELIDDVFLYAQEYENNTNCIAESVTNLKLPEDIEKQIKDFASYKKPGDIVSSEDVKPNAHFYLAAHFSHLFREQAPSKEEKPLASKNDQRLDSAE